MIVLLMNSGVGWRVAGRPAPVCTASVQFVTREEATIYTHQTLTHSVAPAKYLKGPMSVNYIKRENIYAYRNLLKLSAINYLLVATDENYIMLYDFLNE
jgi:hypothetical protein